VSDNFKDFFTYLGFLLAAIGVYLFKYLIKYFKIKKLKNIESRGEEHLNTNSQFIKQVEIHSRMTIVIDKNVRPNVNSDLYDILISHVEHAKARKLESIKIEFVNDVFINSSAVNVIVRLCHYMKENNGIRLVMLFPDNSETAKNLFDEITQLLASWDTGRIELYINKGVDHAGKIYSTT